MDYLWLDKELQPGVLGAGMRQPDGSFGNTLTTTDNAFLGSEVGLGVAYAYTDDVTLGAKFNVFKPGEAFSDSNDKNATQFLVNANVNF